MNKSIKIIDEFAFNIFINSRIPPYEPIYKHLDKLPKKIVDSIKEVKSDELADIRLDHIYPQSS